jgi:hypothetical protein
MVTIQCSINTVKDAKIFLHISGEDLTNEIFKKIYLGTAYHIKYSKPNIYRQLRNCLVITRGVSTFPTGCIISYIFKKLNKYRLLRNCLVIT